MRQAGAVRHSLRRWHIWLGWVVGVPMLMWTLSGVMMVWKPIEEVRGEHLLADPPPIRRSPPPVAPRVDGPAASSLTLEQRAAGPRWVITLRRWRQPRSPIRRAGAAAPLVGRRRGARSRRRATPARPRSVSVTRTDPARPPLDLRRPIAAWQVAMDDGTHFYVDAAIGEIVARRTRLVALLRLDVGPPHHGPADPRGHPQSVDHGLRHRRRW